MQRFRLLGFYVVGIVAIIGLAVWGVSLIHEPGEAVSFDGLLPGASFEDAFDLGPHGLEVAEAGPQRRLQVG